jgi:hypothetical protein
MPPPQPAADLSVDLALRRVRSLSPQSLPQHAFAHLVEIQGDPQPLGGGIRR